MAGKARSDGDLLSHFIKMYDSLNDAVVALKDGQIFFYNEAAAKMIPDLDKVAPEDIFPAQYLRYDAERFAGEMKLGGLNVNVQVTVDGSYRVFTITPADTNGIEDMSNFFSSFSLELKNHLSILKMTTELMLSHIEQQDDPKLTRYASMIYHSYYNILRVTNNVVSIGEKTSGNKTLNRTMFDLIAAISGIANTTQHFVAERGVTIKFESALDSLFVYADHSMIDKLLLNLLSNSLANTPAGGEITVSVKKTNDRFIITVNDAGTGVNPDVLKNVWKRYAAERDLTDPQAGVGLGLSIVHCIALMHGGSVVLESRPGAGTSVAVSIPLVDPGEMTLHTQVVPYEDDLQKFLVELSGVITPEHYTHKYMD